jgi:uncharacterized protein (DUF4415 family)
MKKKTTSTRSQTDWALLDSQQDEDIDLSDNPEISPDMFARAVVRSGLKPAPRKAQLTLRLDRDVLDWFKEQGHGYQTRINALLRAYMEAERAHGGGSSHSDHN